MEKDIRIFGISKEDTESVRVAGQVRRAKRRLFFLFLH
nr:MAG TPA: hypothetical protein [Caudoviricetes sp.]